MRGEIWTAVGTSYASKPRPVVIIQDDRFDATDSLTVALLTSAQLDLPLLRVPISPGPTNGLAQASDVMVDKVMTIRRSNVTNYIGRLGDDDVIRINRALLVFLGLAS